MRPPNDQQDRFFLWGMVFLPILALTAYIFDAFYYYECLYRNSSPIYEGLLSSILIFFSYLQYCAPIESRHLRLAYHLLLWILVEIGNAGYLLSFIHLGNLFSTMIFMGRIVCDTLFTAALLYCRVYRELDHHIDVDNRHIFHFLSRLEVILAIFIPIFINPEYSTITQDNIGFFLLFDFFSEKYERFKGIWIKSCLYLFVATVTLSSACEWLYFTFKNHTFENITDVSELVSACFCYILIIMQFFEFHFKSYLSQDIPQKLQITVISSKPIADV